jgi:hypothetical protein
MLIQLQAGTTPPLSVSPPPPLHQENRQVFRGVSEPSEPSEHFEHQARSMNHSERLSWVTPVKLAHIESCLVARFRNNQI